ncbi:hypothetical protein M9458_009088, partial [Cirrhinus mrigala]
GAECFFCVGLLWSSLSLALSMGFSAGLGQNRRPKPSQAPKDGACPTLNSLNLKFLDHGVSLVRLKGLPQKSSKYQPTTTTFGELQSSTVQIGTVLPLKSAKLPIIDLLRNKQRLDRPEPFKLDPNYDLDHWPNNAQGTAKTPQTATSQISKPETQTYTVSTAQSTSTTYATTLRMITEPMNTYIDQTVPIDTPSATSELTTQTYTVSTALNTSTTQTTTQRLITKTVNPFSDRTVPVDTQAKTSELTIASFPTTHFITPAGPMLEVSTETLTTASTGQNTLGTAKPEWTPFKTTDKAVDGFAWIEQTTGPTEGGRVQSFGSDPTPTLPAGGKSTPPCLFISILI